MLYQVIYTLLALSALVAGFFAGRKIHHIKGTTLLWVVLLIAVTAMSPEVMDICGRRACQSHRLGSVDLHEADRLHHPIWCEAFSLH